MEDTISQAIAEFIRAKDRIGCALATTPDEKLDWAPSPSARSAVKQVAHAAIAIPFIQSMLAGEPFPYQGVAELDAAMRAAEAEITTRQQALDLLDRNGARFLAWVDTLTADQLASTVQPPFPPMTLAAGITIPADHIRGHAAQIDYIQTIYGDLDWHM